MKFFSVECQMKLTIVKCVKESDWGKKQEELTCKSGTVFNK